jgi:heterodisulfide reductase subunit B
VTIGERVDVRCLLDALVNVVGLDAIQAKVQKPLAGLKTVAYYGCLLVRPHAVTRFDDPEDPQTMDRLLTALGAEVRPWYHKTECCGAGLSLTKTDVMVRLAGELLAQAKAAGADCIVTACPFCQFNLDSRQAEAAALRGDKFGVPIVYFTQLMGLAFGLSPKQLGLDRHLVSVKPLLAALRREQPTTTAP